MKTNPSCRQKNGDEGSTLLIVLIVGLVTLPLLWSYLTTISSQHRSVARSQDWNAAIPIVEAGIEEAMAHLNKNCHPGMYMENTINWEADGWVQVSTGVFTPSTPRFIGASYYEVKIITNAPSSDMMPEIVCVAYNPTYAVAAKGFMFAALANSPNETGKTYISRQVRVETARKPLYDKPPLTADGHVDACGLKDSRAYDPTDPNKSWFGFFSMNYTTAESGIGSLTNDVNLCSQSRIYGDVFTSADGSVRTNGSVGDKAWVDGNNPGIQDGHYHDDVNTDLPEVEAPPGADSWPFLQRLSPRRVVTLTNYPAQAGIITTNVYPNPPPPNGVPVRTNGIYVDSFIYPSGHTGSVETNTTSYTTTTLPNPIPPGMTTNSVTNFFTNPSPNIYNPPAYPTNFTTPPGVTTNLAYVTNVFTEPGPAANLRVGPATAIGGHVANNKGIKDYNYAYNRIMGYNYQRVNAQSYTWLTNVYTYFVDDSYTYVGPIYEQTTTVRQFDYVLEGGDFRDGDLSPGKMLVLSGRNRLYLNSLSMNGQAEIMIRPGASLHIFLKKEMSVTGNAQLSNLSTDALALQIWGLPTCDSVKIAGNGSVTGLIYAPQAFVHLGGGGRYEDEFNGWVVGGKMKLNGHIHHLAPLHVPRLGPSQGYFASSWKEEKVGQTR